MKKLLILLLITLSSSVFAEQTFFVKYEWNDDDKIVGFGASKAIFENRHGFQAQAVASLNYNEVLTTSRQLQDFYSLDTGFRMGYFDELFLYVEAGIDVLDLFYHDQRYDGPHYRHREDTDNNPDGFAGLTMGVEYQQIRLSGFVKARQIDADDWQSEHNLFWGAQLSVVF